MAAAAAKRELSVNGHETGNDGAASPVIHGATELLCLHAEAGSRHRLPGLDARASERLAEAPLARTAGVLVSEAELKVLKPVDPLGCFDIGQAPHLHRLFWPQPDDVRDATREGDHEIALHR